MRSAALVILALGIGVFAFTLPAAAQKVAIKVEEAPPPPEAKKEEGKKDEPFDQKKADLETIKSAGYTDDTKSLTDFFRNHTVTEADNIQFTLLTNNTNQIHFNREYGAATEWGRCLVNSALTLSVVAGWE